MAQEPKRAPHLPSHQEDRLWQWVERYVQPRVDWRKHGRMLERSYDPIVPVKVGNRRAPARGGHGTHWREGGSKRTNLLEGNITRLRTRNDMSTDTSRIAELAKEDPKRQFYSIAHLITGEKMHEAFRSLRKDASAGIDGVTYQQYEVNVEGNIRQLHQRLKQGKYQVQSLRRVYIPKEDGKQRPISIPALEDKLVQKVVVELLNAIYEQDFLHCSYGFRPGRGQHQALDEVGRAICTRPVGWVLEIDIRSYFDSIVRSALVEMIEKRVTDGSVLRLIGKWIKVGVIEDGRLLVSETGTGQGQPISPLLANVYLHYVLDEWFESEVKPRLRGEAYEIRFADDAILCFQHKEDAEKVLKVLPKRFEKYGLTLHPEKTRLIEFGRYAAKNARKQGKKPATFNFLGFVHICARSRQGKFTVHVKTVAKRLARGLKAVWEWCQQHRHDPVSEQQKTLNAKLRGHYQYYGRRTNYRAIQQFAMRVRRIWRVWLSRRTRGKRLTWERFAEILRQHPLLPPRITQARAGAGSHA
jgi:group II intron reverse transcriptase/maturase